MSKISKFSIEICNVDDAEKLEKTLKEFVWIYGTDAKVKWLGNETIKEPLSVTAQLTSMEQQLKAISLQMIETMKIHREAIKSHTFEIRHIREALIEHTATGNPLHVQQ